MKKLVLKIKKLYPNAKLPSYAHPGDAGLDLYCREDVIIKPDERKVIGTGIAIELPSGWVSLIWDKSGLAAKSGLTCLGGVIEYTYRGEYMVPILNTSNKTYKFEAGDKIAQLLIQPIAECQIEEVTDLSKTKRGEGKFGSSGKR